jgi:hypothetical protein
LLLEAAVSDLTEPAEEDGSGERIASLTLVESGVNASAEFYALNQDRMKSVRSIRPSSRNATAKPF